MDNTAFFSNLKDKFSKIKDKIVTWIKENKKLSLIIGSLIVIMVICLIILISITGNKKQDKTIYEDKLQLTEELVVPNGPALPRDYTISRETKENWTDEESEKWFTSPSDKDINGLSKANDNIINEILGAAP